MTDIQDRLNSEQSKLVEDNAQLIYGFINKHHLPADDFYGMCAVGLCKAAKSFDPSKGAFSTYAYLYMSSELNHHTQKDKKQIKACISLDAPIEWFNRSNSTVGEFLIGTDNDIIESLSAACTPGVDQLTAREKTVALYLTVGLSSREIGQILGVSHARVYQHKVAIKKKLSVALHRD